MCNIFKMKNNVFMNFLARSADSKQFPMQPRCPLDRDYKAGDWRRPDWAVGPLGPYSSRPAQSSSSYPLCITRVITAFIKSALQQCLSIQLTFKMAIMWHVEVVWWLGATISCFWKGLLCILTSMNKGEHSRNDCRLFCLCLWGAKAQNMALACHQSVAWLTSDFTWLYQL